MVKAVSARPAPWTAMATAVTPGAAGSVDLIAIAARARSPADAEAGVPAAAGTPRRLTGRARAWMGAAPLQTSHRRCRQPGAT